ncbi:MAG: beta-galactosidase trimerization domain-containing protein [Elusimicrobiota bacterium]
MLLTRNVKILWLFTVNNIYRVLAVSAAIVLLMCGVSSAEKIDAGANVSKISVISENVKPPVIDGDPEDYAWQTADPLGRFYNVDGVSLARKQTEVRVAVSKDKLYILFKCLDPRAKWLKNDVLARDARVWDNDCIEFYVSPQSEATFHFVINSTGTVFDEQIIVVESAKGFEKNAEWNATNVVVGNKVYDDYWVTEIELPLKEIGGDSIEKFDLNFCREEKELLENSAWSATEGGFYQPDRFGILDLKAGIVKREPVTAKNAAPYTITREKEVFKELISSSTAGYVVNSWYHDLGISNLPKYLQEKLQDKTELEKYVTAFMEEVYNAGFLAPRKGITPGGSEFIALKKWPRIIFLESSPLVNVAEKNGAEVVFPSTTGRKRVSIIDPLYVDAMVNELKAYAVKYSSDPAILGFRGMDEPLVRIPQKSIAVKSKNWKKYEEEVKSVYGYGKYGIPYIDDPEIVTSKDVAFMWLAYNRWAAEKFFQAKKRAYDVMKSIAPQKKYQPCDYWFMGGFSPFNFYKMSDAGDEFACDPYTTSADKKHNRTPGRGLFNHGFGTKFLSDMVGGKPVWAIVQAFFYDGYRPTDEDMREWCSQAIKMGAMGIEYYANDCPSITDPERWKMMLHIAKVYTSMGKIKLPEKTGTAILYSADSYFTTGYSLLADEIYTVYSLLGEKNGCWFNFVCDEQIEQVKGVLSNYKVLYAPFCEYERESVVKEIDSWVLNGGTLVAGDPRAFSWNINGESLDYYREKILGIKLEGEDKTDSIIFEDDTVFSSAKKGEKYAVLGLQRGRYKGLVKFVNKVTVTDTTAKIVARLDNGNPGIIVRNYGKGKVIYFAANPFSPQVLLDEPKWAAIVGDIEKMGGEPAKLPIWNFRIPKPVH